MWTWDPQIIPGLLQTAEYTRAMMLGWHQMFAGPPARTSSGASKLGSRVSRC